MACLRDAGVQLPEGLLCNLSSQCLWLGICLNLVALSAGILPLLRRFLILDWCNVFLEFLSSLLLADKALTNEDGSSLQLACW